MMEKQSIDLRGLSIPQCWEILVDKTAHNSLNEILGGLLTQLELKTGEISGLTKDRLNDYLFEAFEDNVEVFSEVVVDPKNHYFVDSVVSIMNQCLADLDRPERITVLF